jgi:hypothetical protein
MRDGSCLAYTPDRTAEGKRQPLLDSYASSTMTESEALGEAGPRPVAQAFVSSSPDLKRRPPAQAP